MPSAPCRGAAPQGASSRTWRSCESPRLARRRTPPCACGWGKRLILRQTKPAPPPWRGLCPLAKGARLLLPQSDRANPATAEILRARGASIAAVIAYRTLAGSGGVDLEALLSRGEVDALTFASPSAITFCLRRCRHPKILDLPAACMGEAHGGGGNSSRISAGGRAGSAWHVQYAGCPGSKTCPLTERVVMN